MNKRKLLSMMMILVVLSWCGQEVVVEEKPTVEAKKDFFVTSSKVWEFWKEAKITKTWRLVGSQDITINSQASWKVVNIMVKEWQSVNQWDLLIGLADNLLNYEQSLKSAQNALDTARINYENNKISIEKNIVDAKLNLEKTENDFASAKRDIEENISKAEKDLEIAKQDVNANLNKAESDLQETNLNNEESQASKNLEKLRNDISKAKLDYENLLKSNQQTIEWFVKNTEIYYNSIKLSLDDIILFSDKILWVTTENEHYNNWYEIFLWAKDPWNKTQAEMQLIDLIELKKEITKKNWWTINQDELITRINELESAFKKIDLFLKTFKNVLKDTVGSQELTSATIDWYINWVNWYQASVNSSLTQINTFYVTVSNFMWIYKDQEKSAEKWIESLNQQLSILESTLTTSSSNAQIWLTKTQLAWESWILAAETWLTKTKISADITIKSYEIALQNAKNNYNNLLNTKDLTLRTLQNSIDQALIQYETTQKEYQKLFVKAPISGKIAKIFVDKWQDVGMWTPLIQVVNSSQPEISVSFNSNEINYITLNDEVTFEYENNIYTWNVISIWNVADQNLNYTVKVWIKETITRIWDFVKVDFTFKSDKIILPLNYSYIEWNWKWYIFILTWENFERLPVTFGKTWLDRIEILSEIDENLEMITSDIKNFDNRKFNIVIQK